jgi:hypothetical protein
LRLERSCGQLNREANRLSQAIARAGPAHDCGVAIIGRAEEDDETGRPVKPNHACSGLEEKGRLLLIEKATTFLDLR